MGFVNFLRNDFVSYSVYAVCSALMLGLLAYALAHLFFVGTAREKLDYLKNYKKGQFLVIYIIAIPLYFMGFVHLADFSDGADHMRLFECFLNSVTAALSLVKLDFGMGDISAFMRADAFYAVVTSACFLLTIFNVVMFTASLLWQRLWNVLSRARAISSSTLYIVVGGTETNIRMLSSIRAKGRKCLMFASPNAAMRDELYIAKVPYVKFDCGRASVKELGARIEALFGRELKRGGFVEKNIVLILNTEQEDLDLILAQEAEDLLDKEYPQPFSYRTGGVASQKAERASVQCLRAVPLTAESAFFSVYLYGELANKSIYYDMIEKANGHLTFLNRYEMVAIDFLKRYPLTHFMTNEQIDATRAVVRDDWELNVCMVGFGPTSKQIFLRMVSDAQFYTERAGRFVHKKVHYYFFDRTPVYMDKNFNSTYNRYTQGFLNNEFEEGQYLPLPDYPADDGLLDDDGKPLSWDGNKHFRVVDVNDYRFIQDMRDILLRGKKSFNYVIISFGDDLDNVDLAQKIQNALEFDGVSHKTYIFAKVRDKQMSERLGDLDGENPILPFGCSDDAVYDIVGIAEDPIRLMAQYKSFSYSRGAESGEPNHYKRYEAAVKKWLSYTPEQRDSNYFSCLDLRLKLNLLGFDYATKDVDIPEAKYEFYRAYFGTDDVKEVNKRRAYFTGDYDTSIFSDDSVRTLLARQEHLRWNAYQISCGCVPLPLRDIRMDIETDAVHRRHGNLTTFEGLNTCRKELKGKQDDLHTGEKRVYDYKPLDIADLILHDAGFKIVKKQH